MMKCCNIAQREEVLDQHNEDLCNFYLLFIYRGREKKLLYRKAQQFRIRHETKNVVCKNITQLFPAIHETAG